VANKMADKKKNTSRPASQTTRATLKTSEKDQPVKSISAMARDGVKDTKATTKPENKAAVKSISAMARDEVKDTKATTKPENKAAVKSISAMARDEVKDTKATTKPESKLAVKSTGTALRSEPKKERTVQESRARRDTREPSWLLRLRNSRIGRFVFEAYYELRHKVTWPTFEEARNMTLIVIVLSLVIGLALFAVDSGLYNLFVLISGGK